MKKIDLQNLKAWVHWRVIGDEKATAESLEFTYVIKSLIDSHALLVDALKIIAKAHEVKRGACMKEAIAIRARQALKEAGEE